jgi:hypothetical protein
MDPEGNPFLAQKLIASLIRAFNLQLKKDPYAELPSSSVLIYDW